MLAYYFYRLFPTSETRGLQLIENHIFNEEDLMRRVEQYDHMKRHSALHVGVQNPLSVLSTVCKKQMHYQITNSGTNGKEEVNESIV